MGRDVHAKLTLDDMVPGHVVFAASGVTHGSMFEGVHFEHGVAHVDTLVWDSFTGRRSRVRSVYPELRCRRTAERSSSAAGSSNLVCTALAVANLLRRRLYAPAARGRRANALKPGTFTAPS